MTERKFIGFFCELEGEELERDRDRERGEREREKKEWELFHCSEKYKSNVVGEERQGEVQC